MKKGFTLIELLIAITIIAVLSAIGLTTFSNIQSKARDSVRKNDLNTLATALEIYFQKNGKYIGSGDGTQDKCQEADLFYQDIASYLNTAVPKDPKEETEYCYQSADEGLNYKLYAKLDDGTDYILTSEDYLAQASPTPTSTGPTSSPSPTPTAAPIATPTPTPTSIPTPTPLPPNPTNPGEGDCRWQDDTAVIGYAFVDTDFDPTTWPQQCTSSLRDGSYTCPYPSYSTFDGPQLIPSTTPHPGVIIHADGNYCNLNFAFITGSSGLVGSSVPRTVGRSSTSKSRVYYRIWAEIPQGQSFTRGTCYLFTRNGPDIQALTEGIALVRSSGNRAECSIDLSSGGFHSMFSSFGFE